VNRFSPPAEPTATLTLAAIIAVVVTWGLASPLLKLASLSGPALSAYRLWIGASVLIAFMIATRRRLDMPTARWAAMAGALFGANILFFVVGVKLTTVANATLIGALQPAIVLFVAGPWFGETITRREVACVAVAITGVAVVILGSAGVPEWNPAGDAMAVMAVLTFTGYFLISKRARATVSTIEYMTGVHLAAAVVVTPFALAAPGELAFTDATDVFVVLFFALVSGTLGQVVVGWAQRYVDVSLSSLVLLGVPVIAAGAAWLMLDEAITSMQAVGGVITLAGIGAMVWRPAREPGPGVEWEAVSSSER
jgi:drug/metabolite transporter (DMT)-like permease